MRSFVSIPVAAVAVFSLAWLAPADAQKARKPSPGKTAAKAVDARFRDLLGESFDSELLGGVERKNAAFGFGSSAVYAPPDRDALAGDLELANIEDKTVVVAVAADGKSAWVAANLDEYEPCGDETCPRHPKPSEWYHVTAVFDGPAWQPLAFHVGQTVTGKQQAAALKSGVDLDPIGSIRLTGAAAEAVEVFKKTIGDPKVMASTVSARKDVVLYGSELKERIVGGKKVASTLARWNLGFKVRDGIRAGASTSGTVVWIAANLDATSLKRKNSKATPYRALFVYEKTGAWQLVQAHFSFTPW